MIKIVHRVNTIEQLKTIPNNYGVEIDIRSEGQDLILHHDPFCNGEKLVDYLGFFQHKFIILNVKSEGLEDRIIDLMKQFNITAFFFLDLSLPFLVKQAKKGKSKIAIRFSQYEPLEFVLKFKDLVEWVWVDCFEDLPLNDQNYQQLHDYFKICIVSPELQGHDIEKIDDFKSQLRKLPFDAVCTKRPDLW